MKLIKIYINYEKIHIKKNHRLEFWTETTTKSALPSGKTNPARH
jgi:hypothetical protein